MIKRKKVVAMITMISLKEGDKFKVGFGIGFGGKFYVKKNILNLFFPQWELLGGSPGHKTNNISNLDNFSATKPILDL